MTERSLRLVKRASAATDAADVQSQSATQGADADLLARVAAGDLSGLGQLYDRYADDVYRFVRRAAPREDALDVVQTVFVRLLGIAHAYDGRANSARAWIFGVAAHVVRERRRGFARLGRMLQTLVVESRRTRATPEHTGIDLERALARLPESKRVVLLLAEVEGFTCPEIAEMLGIPVGTVWTRLHHARRLVRRHYEEGR